MTALSVIILLASNETAWQSDLAKLSDGTEIMFVTPDTVSLSHDNVLLPNKEIRRLFSAPGRASQMNAGMRAAKGEYMWFLHADSKFGHNTISVLLRAIKNHPRNLLFFDLAFIGDATPLMLLNAWGVRFRSRVLKLAFG